jgi:large subunit ribosomal protein L31
MDIGTFPPLQRERRHLKIGIHPTREAAIVTCATCGATVQTRWAAGDLTVETCSQCHPAYTGRAARQTGGSRIERFERRLARSV